MQDFFMRIMNLIGIAAAAISVYACFQPWVIIPEPYIVITGVDASGTNYGKPGYFNLVMTAFFVFFTIVPRVWAKRANLLVVALNIAWTIRNFFLIAQCEAGVCPQKKEGLYLVFFAAIVMLVTAVFPSVRLRDAGAKTDLQGNTE